ncbi:hypothetical protein ACET3Z_010717 [Daucus carota]
MKKKRSLEEVYNATPEIKQVSSQVYKGVGRSGWSQKSEARVGSGTCNMCSAPCSSCSHSDQPIIRVKANHGKFSGETCRENVSSSVEVAPTFKSRKCETGLHSASEASTVISMNSSYDSFYENAESKFTIRNVELPSTLSGVSTPENQDKIKLHKLKSVRLQNNLKDLRNFQGNEDNVSCTSGADGLTTVSSANSATVGTNTRPTYVPSTNSLVSKDDVKSVPSDPAQCLQKLDVEGTIIFTRSICNDITTQEVCCPVSFPDDLYDSRLLEYNLPEHIDEAAGSVSVQSSNPNTPKEKSSKIYFRTPLPDCPNEYINPSVTSKLVSNTLCRKESTFCISSNPQDMKLGLATEALSSLQHTNEVEKVGELLVLPVAKKTFTQSLPIEALNSTEQNHVNNESDIEEDDQVCDTCGDIGRDNLLVVCFRCSDGAEHTYCMSRMLDKVPEGGWLCQECKMEERNSQKNDNYDEVGSVAHHFSVRNAKISHLCKKSGGKDTSSETNKSNKNGSKAKVPHKRNEDNVDVSSAVNEQALEPTVRSLKKHSLDKVGVHRRSRSVRSIVRGDSKTVHKLHSVAFSFADTKGTEAPELGSLIKSKSFSTTHTKSEFKLLDEVFCNKKSMPNPAVPRIKEGSSRVMGKSVSSKSFDSDHLRNDESNSEMLSPKFSHARDLAGFKHAKEQNFVKRKSSLAQESTNLAEKVQGSSISHPRQCSTAGTKSDSCQKCEDVEVLASDVLTAGNSKEVKDNCNKPQSEIDAAQLKKTGIYRNDRVLDVSTLNSKCEVLAHYQLSISCNSRNLVADDKVLNANCSKQPISKSSEAVNSRIVDSLPNSPIDRIPNVKDLPNQAFKVTSSLLTNTAFPEYEYVWQGCFEVYKREKLPDLYDGLQAHLSSCASPRVIETMKTFPHKVLLNEVPRLSTWPIQFVETGVTEDHIGIYFFARDYESYIKCYKNVVERMMKYDLALKGNLDGAEILIFPSNQLPENSQCWNMMFFLWGVFKGKTVDCQRQVTGPWMKVSGPDLPTAIMSSPENIISHVPIDKEELVSHMDVVSDSLAHLLPLLPAKTCCGTNPSPAFPKVTCPNLIVEQPEYILEWNLLPSNPKCPPQSWPEVRSTPVGKTVGITGSLFPLDLFPVKNLHVGDSSILYNREELQQERVPNLELALGEVISMKESRHDQSLVREETKAEDVTAALSLFR